MKHAVTLCFGLLFLTACQSGHYQHYLNLYDIKPPQTDNFVHCLNYGCQTRYDVALTRKTNAKIQKLFKRPIKTPEAERRQISQAIQIFETDIGALTGTKNDKRGTFRLYQDDTETPRIFQQDCVDESTNTTIYLALLENMELLKFHKPSFPASRQPFISGTPWWHQTAVVENLKNGEKYAIDSWFFDNGAPASVVPLKKWKNGWHPPKKKAQ